MKDKKKIIGIVILVISLVIMIVPTILHFKDDDLELVMKSYCEKVYANLTEDFGVLHLSLSDMEKIYKLNINKFKRNNCNLDESMVKAYVKDKQLVCEVNLICKDR